MLHKSIGGGRTRSPLKSVQLARQSLAQVAQTSSNQINLGQQRWANLEKQKPSSDASQRLTSVKDSDVSLTLDRMPVGSSIVGSSPSKSSPLESSLPESSILGSSSRLLESSASVAIVPSKKQPTSGENSQGSQKSKGMPVNLRPSLAPGWLVRLSDLHWVSVSGPLIIGRGTL